MKEYECSSDEENIVWAYSMLVVCCIFRTSDSVETAVEENLCCGQHENRKPESIGLFFTGVDDLWSRTRTHIHDSSMLEKKRKSTRDRIDKFALESVKVQDFLIVYVICRLKSTFVDELSLYSSRRGIDNTSYKYNELLNDLVNDLLPEGLGERVNQSSSFQSDPHVIYLEPRRALALEDKENLKASDVKLLQQLGLQLGVHLGWVVPAKFRDYFVLSGAGIGNRESSFVVVKTIPTFNEYLDGEWSDSFVIPWLPLALLKHSITFTITKYSNRLLQSHVFFSKDYWKLGDAWGSFYAYRSEYLHIRLEAEQLVIKTDELSLLLENQFSTDALYDEKRFIHYVDQIKLNSLIGESIKASMPLFLKSQRLDSGRWLSESLTKFRSRISLLDEFLRDSGVADATHANLKLASSVQSLTWVVTAIAVLTFFVTLIPDAMKTSILSRLLDKTTMDWLLHSKD
jgi:hypothetical protein